MRPTLLLLSLFIALPAVAEPSPDLALPTWKKHCAACHGADGKAQTKMGAKYGIADLTEPGWARSWDLGRVKKIVEKGVRGKMPAWKDKLSAAELDQVSAYVLHLGDAPKKAGK